jgi:hypothetical protein
MLRQEIARRVGIQCLTIPPSLLGYVSVRVRVSNFCATSGVVQCFANDFHDPFGLYMTSELAYILGYVSLRIL